MNDMTTPRSVRAALDEILPRVEKPSRYLGLERNVVRKPWESVALHVALAFPDSYEIGISHQGSHILYHLVNRRSDAAAERCYAPMPDMAEAMRTAGVPLYTLESYRPAAAFDIIGITLQTELNYSNIPYLLDLAGLPRRACDRSDARAPQARGRSQSTCSRLSPAGQRIATARWNRRRSAPAMQRDSRLAM